LREAPLFLKEAHVYKKVKKKLGKFISKTLEESKIHSTQQGGERKGKGAKVHRSMKKGGNRNMGGCFHYERGTGHDIRGLQFRMIGKKDPSVTWNGWGDESSSKSMTASKRDRSGVPM